MGISINTNVGALSASAASAAINKSMETSMERLSTGKRVNTAADDAAGVAIASRLTSEIRGTNQAIRNAADSQALIDTAEGAHSEVVNLLNRMRELAVQAANDTNNDADRNNLQLEVNQLVAEIDRISSVTTWAGRSLLNGDGAVGNVGTKDSNKSFGFHLGSGTAANDHITVSIDAIDAKSIGVAGVGLADLEYTSYSGLTSAGSNNFASGGVTFGYALATGTAAASAGVSGVVTRTITIANVTAASSAASGTFSFVLDGNDISVTIGAGATTVNDNGVAAATANAITAAGIAGITASVSGAVVTISKTAAVSLATANSSRDAIDDIDGAIAEVNTQRAKLGSVSNRLDSTISNLTNISTNLEAGRGRIEDADFAAETTNLAKAQILQQASMAMLAQANASKQGVLSLLQR